LKALPLDEFIALAQPHLQTVEGFDAMLQAEPGYTRAAIELARDRIYTLSDIAAGAQSFFTDNYSVDEAGAAKHLTDVSRPRLAQLRERLAALDEWTHENIDAALRALATDLAIKPAELIHPSRMAVSGRTVGPSVFHLLEALGRDRVLRRLERAATG
jgi:glutamyl-tRNA synthetase